ncbi:TonB-dependent receptor [Marinifilum breve]|uniref:TonB-dependent receptor n=1 Tax=Marinifilum breve TaxID=2184082 RepID=A0A2V3ZSD7_9BACT|nr:TonB-dependent receptor [Marinifilum breve]PXX96047.1 TonB-dependent receptor [Marinifilum breve]
MQKIYVVAIMLLISVTFVNAQNAVLKGVVTQKSNQQAMPGASVYFSGTTTGTATNNKGEYKIKNLKPGDYDLVVSFSGYSRQKQKITLKEGINVLNFAMVESKSQLGEIVVTGTGTAHHLKTAPVQTELIGKKAIASSGASDFNELMMSVSPSFDFNPGTMGGMMTINGLGNDFILVLVDGKRMYGDVGGNTDLNRINPDDVERIEVLKGASSLLYGSDAIAGVVNIITKKSKQKVNISNTSRIREHRTYQQSNAIDLNLGKFSWNGNFNHKRSDGWKLSPFEIDDDELVETDKRAQYEYNDFTFAQTLKFRATKRLEMYAGNSFFKKHVKRPTSIYKYGYFYTDKSFEVGAKYLLNKKDYVSVDYNFDQYRYYYRYNQDYKTFTKSDKEIQNDQRMSNFRMKYVNVISKNNTLTLGADYLKEKMVSEDRLVNGKADAKTIALYAQEEIKLLEKLQLVAGTRYVKHNEFGSAFTPKVSLLYKLNHFNFRGTYGFGFKAPTVKELYYAYEKRGNLYLGNEDLDPQKSRYSSLGVEFHNDFLSASITGYINKVDDLIAYETVDLLPEDKENKIKRRRKHYNVDESKSQGIDFLLNAKLGAGFTLGGGYSYVNAKDETTGEKLDGVAENYGNVRLAYDRSWKNYSFNATILGRIQDEKSYDNGEDNAKGYDLWKLTTNHKFLNFGSFILEAQLGVDNIFDYVDDSPYGSHYGTINPGRTFFAGIKINFAK